MADTYGMFSDIYTTPFQRRAQAITSSMREDDPLGNVGKALGLFFAARSGANKPTEGQENLKKVLESIGENPTPDDLEKIGFAFIPLDPDLGARYLQESRLLRESMGKKSKVASPGSPVLREVKSGVSLLDMDPDLSGEGIRNIGLNSEEKLAAGREIAARARELQKQYAAEGSTLNYTEAEQIALDMMKQEGLFQQSEKLGGAFRSWSYMPKQMQEKAITMQPGEQREVVERRTKDGKIGLFDANTKEFIGYK